MRVFDEVELLRHPIIGVWRIEGAADDVPGVMSLEEGELVLTLLVVDVPRRNGHATHSVIDAIKPPRQPNIVGATTKGAITLFRCARRSQYESLGQNGRGQVEIRLTPHEAFLGSATVDPAQGFNSLSFRVKGLHSILSTERARTYTLRDPDSDDKEVDRTPEDVEDADPLHETLRAVTDAHSAVLIHKTTSPTVEVSVGGRSFKILFYSGRVSSASLTEGDSDRTSNSVHITSEGALLSELRHVAMEVRNFLGIFCLCQVAVDQTMLHRHGPRFTALSVWRLGHPVGGVGEARASFDVWCALGQQPDILQQALRMWFDGNDQRRLARWLLYDGLSEEPLNTSRFLAAAQVWEILGRELHSDHKKPTFATAVRNCLDRIPGPIRKLLVADDDGFVRQVVQVRNALSHMRAGNSMTLDEASRIRSDLTLKLLAGACIIEAWSLKLPLGRFDLVMRRNKLAAMATWDTDG